LNKRYFKAQLTLLSFCLVLTASSFVIAGADRVVLMRKPERDNTQELALVVA